MSSGRGARGRGALAPYLLIAFLYLATWPFHHGLNNPNEMVRVYLTKALVEDKSFVIDRIVAQWGPVDDKAIRNGKLYSSKAPFQSLAGVPVYAALKKLAPEQPPLSKRTITTVLRVFCSALPGFLIAAVLLAWSRRRATELGESRAAGTALGLVFALGTMIYPYAITFTGHILAAVAAGGCYLAVLGLSRAEPGSRRWRWMAVLAGLGGGASPFSEYPSALIAGPALLAALAIAPGWKRRAELVLLLALGGAAPFALGLWAHAQSWGSPFKTGYSFLENASYVEVHREGFFGVRLPKAEAVGGSLFSPGTGLFFFSPILAVGAVMLILEVFRRRRRVPRAPLPAAEGALPEDPTSLGGAEAIPAEAPAGSFEAPPAPASFEAPAAPAILEAPARAPAPAPEPQEPPRLHRALAVAALAGVIFEVLFIGGHTGWRGGWTVGPRYIIAVAPVLAVWVIEALRYRRLRALLPPLGAVSIAATGFAAALYPHLSDVYINPLKTFLFPSYLRGEHTYGVAHSLGLTGTAANLVHLVPLIGALVFAGLALAIGRGPRALRRSAIATVAGLAAFAALVIAIPEHDKAAAQRENLRLWGFWEPARPLPPEEPEDLPTRPDMKADALVFRARQKWRSANVVAELSGGNDVVRCRWEADPKRCSYGGQPWQVYGPEMLEMNGQLEPLLHLHPISRWVVRASFMIPPGARRGILRYGLSDASFTSDNKAPVDLKLLAGTAVIAEVQAGSGRGLMSLPFTLTSSIGTVGVEIRCDRDGARVLGFDLELYKD